MRKQTTSVKPRHIDKSRFAPNLCFPFKVCGCRLRRQARRFYFAAHGFWQRLRWSFGRNLRGPRRNVLGKLFEAARLVNQLQPDGASGSVFLSRVAEPVRMLVTYRNFQVRGVFRQNDTQAALRTDDALFFGRSDKKQRIIASANAALLFYVAQLLLVLQLQVGQLGRSKQKRHFFFVCWAQRQRRKNFRWRLFLKNILAMYK